VANYDTSGHVYDASTIAGTTEGADEETNMDDDATGFESRSFCHTGAGMKTTGLEDDDDMSEMTGFMNFDGNDNTATGVDNAEAEAEATTQDMAWLAALGRNIGTDTDVKAEFLAFLQSRSSAAFSGDVLKPESAAGRLHRVTQGRAQQSGTLHAGPHVGVGEGSVGQPQVGQSRRGHGDPRGETGKNADDQRADDPG
jgi:hypothetical protein